jgi:glycosyltransferase involved in cell wall biosynthesis
VSEADNGIFDAMNKGMKAASGEYIIYMNSGDWFADKVLTDDLLTQLRGAIFYGDYLLFDGEKSISHKQTPEIDFLYLIFRTICHQSLFMKTDLCRKYPFREDLSVIGDWMQLFTIMKLENPEVVYYPKPICHYDATGLSVKQNEKRLLQREQFLREWYGEWELKHLRQLGRMRGRSWYSWVIKGLDSRMKHFLLQNLSKWIG